MAWRPSPARNVRQASKMSVRTERRTLRHSIRSARAAPCARCGDNQDMAKTVAVIGASSDRAKFGNKALRAFRAEGYTVFPINPNEQEVEGLRTYASVVDVPETIDMATVYVQPDVVMRLLDDFERKQIPEIW